MSNRNFREMLKKQWSQKKFLCVGLDVDFDKIPQFLRKTDNSSYSIIVEFNEIIINATKEIVCAYELNPAFYELHGPDGILALQRTVMDIHTLAPDVPVILDGTYGNIRNINEKCAEMVFDLFGADAVTVQPYLGAEAFQPFSGRVGKGIFVLCCTPNIGAGEFQNLKVLIQAQEGEFLEKINSHYSHCVSVPMLEHVAYQVASCWNKTGNCGLAAGATCPGELEKVRKIVGDMPILISDIGTQKGDNLKKTVIVGQNSHRQGIIISFSRSIIFASGGQDFAEAARREAENLNNLIKQYIFY